MNPIIKLILLVAMVVTGRIEKSQGAPFLLNGEQNLKLTIFNNQSVSDSIAKIKVRSGKRVFRKLMLRVGDKDEKNNLISTLQFSEAESIEAVSVAADDKINVAVNEYILTISDWNQCLATYSVKGGKIGKEIKLQVNKLSAGAKLFIEAKVLSPDGCTQILKLALKIK